MKFFKGLIILLICTGLGFFMCIQYKSLQASSAASNLENKTEQELISELISERNTTESLRAKLTELEDLVTRYENAQDEYEKISIYQQEIEKYKTAAGLTDVKGEGITVTVETNSSSDFSEKYMLMLINNLHQADAQAISINGQRIGAMTDISTTSLYGREYYIINGQIVFAPYEIKAIGNATNMESSLMLAEGIIDTLKTICKNDVHIVKSDEVIINKMSQELLRTDYIHAAEN